MLEAIQSWSTHRTRTSCWPADTGIAAAMIWRGAGCLLGWSSRSAFICWGWLSQEQLARLYGEADILVVPSWYSHSGWSCSRGCCLGWPSASSVGGPAEILDHERTGLLFPPRDAMALAQALVRLIKVPALRHQLPGELPARECDRIGWYSRVMKGMGGLCRDHCDDGSVPAVARFSRCGARPSPGGWDENRIRPASFSATEHNGSARQYWASPVSFGTESTYGEGAKYEDSRPGSKPSSTHGSKEAIEFRHEERYEPLGGYHTPGERMSGLSPHNVDRAIAGRRWIAVRKHHQRIARYRDSLSPPRCRMQKGKLCRTAEHNCKLCTCAARAPSENSLPKPGVFRALPVRDLRSMRRFARRPAHSRTPGPFSRRPESFRDGLPVLCLQGLTGLPDR